jgi:hypothetical protein
MSNLGHELNNGLGFLRQVFWWDKDAKMWYIYIYIYTIN